MHSMILLTPSQKLFTLINVIVLLITCIFNFVMSPLILCLLDGNCAGMTFTSLQGMYSRMIAVACFLSLSTLLCKYSTMMPVFDKNIEAYEVYSPTTETEHRNHSLFYLFLTVLNMSVILPINVLRLILMYRSDSGSLILVFFVFMYLENIGMCMIETYFIILCHKLDHKFFKINCDLERLGWEIVKPAMSIFENTVTVGHRVVYHGDFYGPNDHSIANEMEIIRIRHRLIRDAVYLLIDLFGIPMGLSLFTLCVMTLFDIYYQVFNVMGSSSRSLIFIYMWLLQYSIRFYTIIVAADNTTKQVNLYSPRV